MTDFRNLIAAKGSENWDRRPPAPPRQVAKLQSSLPFALPADYLDFLLYSNGAYGEIPVKPYWCIIFTVNEVLDENIGHEINERLPGYFAFASSGNGELLTFKTAEFPNPVYSFAISNLDAHAECFVAANILDLICMLGKANADKEES